MKQNDEKEHDKKLINSTETKFCLLRNAPEG